MKEHFKRYIVAFIILGAVIVMMLIGTLGVTLFEKKMFQDVNVTIKPRGEKIE